MRLVPLYLSSPPLTIALPGQLKPALPGVAAAPLGPTARPRARARREGRAPRRTGSRRRCRAERGQRWARAAVSGAPAERVEAGAQPERVLDTRDKRERGRDQGRHARQAGEWAAAAPVRERRLRPHERLWRERRVPQRAGDATAADEHLGASHAGRERWDRERRVSQGRRAAGVLDRPPAHVQVRLARRRRRCRTCSPSSFVAPPALHISLSSPHHRISASWIGCDRPHTRILILFTTMPTPLP